MFYSPKNYGAKVRIFDAGEKAADRYTILPPRYDRKYRADGIWAYIACDAYPFHPLGFGQHGGTNMVGPHLGKRIAWCDLPEQAQQFARDNFPEYCPAK
jgi:hypothetical protein